MCSLKLLAQDFLCLLFPDLCNGCGEQLFNGERQICTKCLYDLPYTDFHLHTDNAVARLFWGRIQCHAAMAMLFFKKGTRVQALIHALKYKGKTDLGFKLGVLLGERLIQSPIFSKADLIIPVPLHLKRQRSRGYNQSEHIADGLASVINLPISTKQLIRQRATSTQTKKGRYNRYENMKLVFHVPNPSDFVGKHVILVDDVITTGATLEACGQVLLDSGISNLSIVAIAYAE